MHLIKFMFDLFGLSLLKERPCFWQKCQLISRTCFLFSFFLQLSESKSREEQLKQLMSEKEEKTKKALLLAKVKIGQVNGEFAQTLMP